jgi:hypothetical protein
MSHEIVGANLSDWIGENQWLEILVPMRSAPTAKVPAVEMGFGLISGTFGSALDCPRP